MSPTPSVLTWRVVSGGVADQTLRFEGWRNNICSYGLPAPYCGARLGAPATSAMTPVFGFVAGTEGYPSAGDDVLAGVWLASQYQCPNLTPS